MVIIAGFGNPLLDITVKIHDDKTLLHKYNLNEDDAKEIAADKMKSLLHDILNLNPSLSPGGSAQNTLRILQWVLAKPNSTIMFGGIGQDLQGQRLKGLVESAGVHTRYIVHKNEPTGTSVALVHGSNRSLVAYIGAAERITIDFLQTNDIVSILKTVNLIYMEGYFLTNRKSAAQYILDFCQENNIIFAFNLGAVYMSLMHPEDILHFAKHCDMLIGNRKEYEALINGAKLTLDAQALVVKLSRDYNNNKNLKYGKIVIMTNGSQSVICAHSCGQLEEIAVPKVKASKIGDTTGAGDSFAAGFLGGMFSDRAPISCLKWGCWVAQQIIQQIGCTIPNYSAEFLNTID